MNMLDQFSTLWKERDPRLARELFTADYHGLDLTTQTRSAGPAGVAVRLEKVWRAFPDLEFHAQQVISDTEQLALHWRVRGTHCGVLMNIPPTGQRVEINGMSFLTLRDGRISQAIHLWDMAAMLRTLGLLPELEQRAFPDVLSTNQ